MLLAEVCPSYEAPRYYIIDHASKVSDRVWLAVQGYLNRRITWDEAASLVHEIQAETPEDKGVKLAALCYLRSFRVG
jgi:hypothetical protein